MSVWWQPAHAVPGCSVIDSMTSRVVMVVLRSIGVLAAFGGGGGM